MRAAVMKSGPPAAVRPSCSSENEAMTGLELIVRERDLRHLLVDVAGNELSGFRSCIEPQGRASCLAIRSEHFAADVPEGSPDVDRPAAATVAVEVSTRAGEVHGAAVADVPRGCRRRPPAGARDR